MLQENSEVDDWEPDYTATSLLDFHKAKYTNKEINATIERNENLEHELKDEVIRMMDKKRKEERAADPDLSSDDEAERQQTDGLKNN
jgi:hypothetical protein